LFAHNFDGSSFGARFLHQRPEAVYQGFTSLRSLTDADYPHPKWSVHAIDIATRDRVPESVKIVSVPRRCSDRGKEGDVEVVGRFPSSSGNHDFLY